MSEAIMFGIFAFGMFLIFCVFFVLPDILDDRRKEKELAEAIDLEKQLRVYRSSLEDTTFLVIADRFHSRNKMAVEKEILNHFISKPKIREIARTVPNLPPVTERVVENFMYYFRWCLEGKLSIVFMDRKDVESHLDNHSRHVVGIIAPYNKNNTVEFIAVPSRLNMNHPQYFEKAESLTRHKKNYLSQLASEVTPDEELISAYDSRIQSNLSIGQELIKEEMAGVKTLLSLKSIEDDSQVTLEAWDNLYREDLR